MNVCCCSSSFQQMKADVSQVFEFNPTLFILYSHIHTHTVMTWPSILVPTRWNNHQHLNQSWFCSYPKFIFIDLWTNPWHFMILARKPALCRLKSSVSHFIHIKYNWMGLDQTGILHPFMSPQYRVFLEKREIFWKPWNRQKTLTIY